MEKIEYNAINLLQQLPGFVAWKNCDSVFLGCNENLAFHLDFKHTQNIIGLKDIDLKFNTDELAEFHLQLDKFALQGKQLEVIHCLNTPTEEIVYHLIKKPIYDEKNNINGIVFCCHPLSRSGVISYLTKHEGQYCPEAYIPTYYQLSVISNPSELSSRELEVLFCILRGKTAKQVGEILTLSKRTVESYLINIRTKLNCQNKSALLVKAIELGYMSILPKRFLHQKID